MPHTSLTPATALALAALLAAPVLAGCLERDGGSGLRADAPEPADGPAASKKGWQVGNWWSYKATFEGNVTVDIALVVFEDAPDHVLLGSNLSAGFFGLPFNGNVTRPNLNPVIAGEEWRLFDFPLSHGKSWRYEFLGYTLTAEASEATLRAPRAGEHDGFAMTASSFGRTVVRYTYSPEVEWFTELVLYEPTDGHEVVRVELTDFGESYGADYYVNVPVHETHQAYPRVPADDRFMVEGAYLRLYGTVSLAGKLGEFRFALEDPHGREAMRGEVRPTGVWLDRQELDAAPGAWRVDALGVGQGALHFEMTALKPVRDGRIVAPGEGDAVRDANMPTVDVNRLLGPLPRGTVATPASVVGAVTTLLG